MPATGTILRRGFEPPAAPCSVWTAPARATCSRSSTPGAAMGSLEAALPPIAPPWRSPPGAGRCHRASSTTDDVQRVTCIGTHRSAKAVRPTAFPYLAMPALLLALAACASAPQRMALDVTSGAERRADEAGRARAAARAEARRAAETAQDVRFALDLPPGTRVCHYDGGDDPDGRPRELVRWGRVVDRDLERGRVHVLVAGANPAFALPPDERPGTIVHEQPPAAWWRCPS